MSWPLILGALAVLGGGWLLTGPPLGRAAPSLSPRQRSLVRAGIFTLVALLFFGLRLAPLGVVAAALAIGSASRRISAKPTRQRRADRMSEAEALSVLGLRRGASAEEVDAAHRRMIVRAHPDRGGSDYLAAKVNEARAVLRR